MTTQPGPDFRRGMALGAMGAVCFSAMALGIHAAPRVLTPWHFLFLRGAMGFLVLGPLVAASVPALFRRSAAPVWWRAVFGSAANFCFFVNLRSVSSGVATLLHNSFPVFVALVTSLVAWQLAVGPLLGAAFAVGGVTLLLLPGHFNVGAGSVALGLGGAFLNACGYLSLRAAAQTHGPLVVVWATSLLLMLCSAVTLDAGWLALPPRAWVFLVGVGALNIGGQLLMTLSYRYLNVELASTLILTSVVWTTLFELVSGEVPMSPVGIAGMALVVVGVVLSQKKAGLQRGTSR